MKKFVSLALLFIIVLSGVAFAEPKLSEAGNLLETDIKTYINDRRINSYNVNGYTALIAEDLVKYGFTVDWDSKARILNITKPDFAEFSGDIVSDNKKVQVGKKVGTAYHTDIRTVVDGITVLSYNIGGKTAIFTDALRLFGEVSFDAEERAVLCDIDGLTYKKPAVTITDAEDEEKDDETVEVPVPEDETIDVSIPKAEPDEPEEKDDETVEVSAPEDEKSDELIKEGYYSNGIVPDYTSVTGIELKEKVEKANNYVSYIYDNYDEFVPEKYITHIVDNEEFVFNKADKGEDNTIVYYYTKNKLALAVTIDNDNNTITITCKK